MKKLAKAMYGKSMMKKGGSSKMKKYEAGGVNDFEDRMEKKKRRAETKAEIAQIEGEGTVKTKRDNRFNRVASLFGKGPNASGDSNQLPKGGPMKKGGSTRMKKYAEGGPTLGPVYSGPTGGRGGAGTYEPPVIGKEKSTRKPTSTGKPIKKIGGATKPKAMYGMTAKPSMMRKGGAKKK